MTPNDPAPAWAPDTASECVHAADSEAVRVVVKADRRKRRAPTPDCPHCLWNDLVTVFSRGERMLIWRCGRCSWSWPLPMDRP